MGQAFNTAAAPRRRRSWRSHNLVLRWASWQESSSPSGEFLLARCLLAGAACGHTTNPAAKKRAGPGSRAGSAVSRSVQSAAGARCAKLSGARRR